MDCIVLNRFQLKGSGSFSAHLGSCRRHEFVPGANEDHEVLDVKIGAMLTLDRIKYGDIGSPVMVEVTCGNLASFPVFLAPLPERLVSDVTVDELCVLVLKCKC